MLKLKNQIMSLLIVGVMALSLYSPNTSSAPSKSSYSGVTVQYHPVDPGTGG
ncbi:hypothetical protein WD019_02925 [Fictibacillus sp. Mic-4]|uniref:hypothetical protein n=1 Tax=Fictibacillus sp. Mic-4 TaxID=3132826 RepID=UPI003CF7EF70